MSGPQPDDSLRAGAAASLQAGPPREQLLEEMIMHLERDQLVVETFRPVSRAELGPYAGAALWALRIFSVVVSLMVIYAFVARLS
jgi:hypothetical protein